MKQVYPKNFKLNNLVRAAMGLPFVPIERIENGEAIHVLEDLANEIEESKVKKFAAGFIKYIKKTWINGNYGLATWNLFLHQGVTTNNYAEGYNSKLRHKKVLGLHPNVYLLASVIKDELYEAAQCYHFYYIVTQEKKVQSMNFFISQLLGLIV